MKTLPPGHRERPPLCKVLVEARASANLTQRQVASRLGRAHSYVAKIEGGDRRLDVTEFIELARALQVDPKALFARLEAWLD